MDYVVIFLLVIEMSCRGACHVCPCKEQMALDIYDKLVQVTNSLDFMNRSNGKVKIGMLNDFRRLVKRSKVVIHRACGVF